MADFIPNTLRTAFQDLAHTQKTKTASTQPLALPSKPISQPHLFKQKAPTQYLQEKEAPTQTTGMGLRNLLTHGLGLGPKHDDFALLSAAHPSSQDTSQPHFSEAFTIGSTELVYNHASPHPTEGDPSNIDPIDFNPDLLDDVSTSAPMQTPPVCTDVKTCTPGSVRPPIYTFAFPPSKMVPFPEERTLKGPLAANTNWLNKLEQSHRGYDLESFHNGIPFGALQSALGKSDKNGDSQLNLDEARQAGVITASQANTLKQLARTHQLMPADPKQIDAVALGRSLQAQGVSLPTDLTNALSDLEILNHYLGQKDIAPEEIILQADPKARDTHKTTISMKEYATNTVEQNPQTKEQYRAAKLEYLNLKQEVGKLERDFNNATRTLAGAREKLERLQQRAPNDPRIPAQQAKIDSDQAALEQKRQALEAKQTALVEKGQVSVEGVYAKGGTVVKRYIVGPQTPEQKSDLFGDIYQRRPQEGVTDGYKHDNVGCAAKTDLLHTLILGREINVQKMLTLTENGEQGSKDYGPVKVTHTPGTRTTPFSKDKHNPADPTKPQEENLQAMFDQDVLKPGMVLFINTNANMRLEGESDDMGSKPFGSSDRHWFTYMGKSGDTPIFLDNTGTQYTLQQMITHYRVGREDNVGTPTVLHTVFDFYPTEAERDKFKAFAQKLLGNTLH